MVGLLPLEIGMHESAAGWVARIKRRAPPLLLATLTGIAAGAVTIVAAVVAAVQILRRLP